LTQAPGFNIDCISTGLYRVDLGRKADQAQAAADFTDMVSWGGKPHPWKIGTGEPAMPSVTIADIDERLRRLPPDKLIVVYDFVSYLLERDLADLLPDADTHARAAMLASEAVLRRDWDRPEEDAAWAHL
jgi:hypothetical protein